MALARPARIVLWTLAGVVGVVIVAAIALALTFDPDSFKPRIIAAVRQATGRDLTLQGHMHLGLSLQPTLVVRGVSLSNPPGFSRPQMATLDELDLKLALIPLLSHRIEIARLVLVKPDILLETNAQGRSNWQFTPEATNAAASQPAPAPAGERASTQISVAEVRVDHGTLAWRDDRTGRGTVLGIASLRMNAPSPDADMHLTATATYNGAAFTAAGEFGPLARLQDASATTPWPARMQVEAGGAKLVADGTIAQPLQGRGYAMKLSAKIPDLPALTPFLPGQPLPALRDVSLAAQIADSGAPLPRISGLVLHIGASDLSGTVAGLKLDKLDVSAAALDQPAKIAGQGSFDGSPATLAGTIGAPSALLSGGKPNGNQGAPIPLDIGMQAFGSSLNLKGSVGIGADGRPSLQAELTADKIDADALRGALAKPRAAPAGTAPAAPAPPPVKRANATMIPDTPIPFGLLRLADADARLHIAELKAGGALYRAIAGHLVLHGGKLQADPFAADLPEGHVTASLSADATQGSPPVAFRVQIPALALKPLLAAMGEPEVIDGTLNVQADLRGVGATPHAIASTLDGSFSVTMGKGTVDNRLLGSTLASVLREINLLDLVGRGGTSQIECFAASAAVDHGVATFRSLAFASSLLTVDGGGSVNLGSETLDLRLRPQARVAGTGIVVPLRIAGPWRTPATTPDAAAAVTQNAGTVAGAVLGQTNPLGAIAGALGGKQLLGGSEAGCGAPHTGSGPATHPQQAPKPPNVGNVLKQLFR
jgi:AsmA protein